MQKARAYVRFNKSNLSELLLIALALQSTTTSGAQALFAFRRKSSQPLREEKLLMWLVQIVQALHNGLNNYSISSQNVLFLATSMTCNR
jgi:hypothetical protein